MDEDKRERIINENDSDLPLHLEQSPPPQPMNKLETMQSISFWDVAPCSLVVYRIFSGIFYLNYRVHELVMQEVHSSEILVNFYQIIGVTSQNTVM
jgi:hypothetical protein